MFLTTMLAGQVLGTSRVKGKRKEWGEETVLSNEALETQKCQTGETGAAGRGLHSWILLPCNSWEWVGWVMGVTGIQQQQ